MEKKILTDKELTAVTGVKQQNIVYTCSVCGHIEWASWPGTCPNCGTTRDPKVTVVSYRGDDYICT